MMTFPLAKLNVDRNGKLIFKSLLFSVNDGESRTITWLNKVNDSIEEGLGYD